MSLGTFYGILVFFPRTVKSLKRTMTKADRLYYTDPRPGWDQNGSKGII